MTEKSRALDSAGAPSGHARGWNLASAAWLLLREALRISFDVFKIIVPITLATRILAVLGVIDFAGQALGPAMRLVGLPGSMGLVWATAMVTSLYGGMAVFFSLSEAADMTVAQVSVLATMMLIAHALPVELAIVRKAGARFRAIALLRVLGAFLCGWLLYLIYDRGGWLQEPSQLLWSPGQPDASWAAWAMGMTRNLAMIFVIIAALLLLMRLLDRLGVSRLMIALLRPVLGALGIGPRVAPITIIGMTLGLTYGGGLIIGEARQGQAGPRDTFFCLALMSLSHSLIEDTLLMMALGASVSGILWARLVFSLAVVFLLVRVGRRMSDAAFARWFSRPPPP